MTFKTVLVQLRRVQLLLAGTAISMTYMKLMRYGYLIVWCKLVLCIGNYGYMYFERTIPQMLTVQTSLLFVIIITMLE